MSKIEQIGEYELRLNKMLWAESEIALANCLSINTSDGIVIDVRRVCIEAAIMFIRESFQSITEEEIRDVEVMYRAYYTSIMQMMSNNNTGIPYWGSLYKHQRECLIRGYGRKMNFFALEQRLGKSISAITLANFRGSNRTLILVPNVVKWQWYRDMTKTFGMNPVEFTVLDAAKRHTMNAFNEKYVIMNYDILDKYMDYLLSEKIDELIIDEAQAIKNVKSARSKLATQIVEANPDINITFLSGTPITNRVNDLFAYFRLAGHPLGKSYAYFIKEYTNSKDERGTIRVKSARNTEELRRKMMNFMIRKKRSECLDLPKTTFTVLNIHPEDYRKEYDKILAELAKEEDITLIDRYIHSLNRVVATAKVTQAIEFIDGLLDMERKVVFFSFYTKPLEMLKEHYKDRAVLVYGGSNARQKDEDVEKFKNDPSCQVFLGNMVSAGVGIDLSVADDVIFLHYPFTPDKISQPMDRLISMKKQRPVDAYFMVAEGSIDEYLRMLVGDKAIDADKIIDGGTGDIDYANMREQLLKLLLNGKDATQTLLPAEDQAEGHGKIHQDNSREPEVFGDTWQDNMGNTVG